MANLGSDLRELGHLSRAQELDDKALRLRQKVVGEEHHDTLISMSHVASNSYAWATLPVPGKLARPFLR